MGLDGRREYLKRIYGRYREASRAIKKAILDEFCAVTEYHRKYAIQLLTGPRPEARPVRRRRRPRRPSYTPEAISVLRRIWEAAGYPWSVRLKALLPWWLPAARKRYGFSLEVERQVLAISARQMDRRLAPYKQELKKRLYGRTKPGALLKHQIPIKTDNWDVKLPGFGEIDLVAHCGDSAAGEFIHSLTLTDILTTWTEMNAVMGKSETFVQEALDTIRLSLPFPLLGIDADNGSEFINHHLRRYTQQHDIQFTRGRPYKKDDNAHVEQKNWTNVRKFLGYERYDTAAAHAAIRRLYRNELRLLQNLFLPSVKLVRKRRVGSRLRRFYDVPVTPLDRLIACNRGNPERVSELSTLRDTLDPLALADCVQQQLERIYALANRRVSPSVRAMEAAASAGKAVDARDDARPQAFPQSLGKHSAFPKAPTAQTDSQSQGNNGLRSRSRKSTATPPSATHAHRRVRFLAARRSRRK